MLGSCECTLLTLFCFYLISFLSTPFYLLSFFLSDVPSRPFMSLLYRCCIVFSSTLLYFFLSLNVTSFQLLLSSSLPSFLLFPHSSLPFPTPDCITSTHASPHSRNGQVTSKYTQPLLSALHKHIIAIYF